MYLVKTEAGQRVVKERSIALTPRQRAVLILVDGKKTLADILGTTGASGIGQADIDKLLELGLVSDANPGQTAIDEAVQQKAVEAVLQHKQRTPQERYAEAYPIATQLTASLGLRGFRLNLAVEAATNYDALVAVAPKIREAVGSDKFEPLENALNDR